MLDVFECANDNALKSVVAFYFIQLTGNSKEKIYEISCKTEDVVDMMKVVYGDAYITLRQLAFVCKVEGIPMMSILGSSPKFSLENYFISGHCITEDEYAFLKCLSELFELDNCAGTGTPSGGTYVSSVLNYLDFQSENYEFLASDEDLNNIDEALRLKTETLIDSVYTTSDYGYSYVEKYRLLTEQQQGRLVFYINNCTEECKRKSESFDE